MLFSPTSLPKGPKIDTKKALVLIDFQNDFTSSTGKLPVSNTALFLTKLPSLIAAFRTKGQIVWAKTHFEEPCSSLSPQTGGYSVLPKSLAGYLLRLSRAGSVDEVGSDASRRSARLPSLQDDEETFLSARISASGRCCMPNTDGSLISTELQLCVCNEKDLVLTKTHYSALSSISMMLKLKARLITDLYICGSLSNIGVYSTVLDAVQQGFNVTLIEDCLGYRDDNAHLQAMRQMVDDLGAGGVDYQELMDDLHGLLGDVIPADKYTRTFQISNQYLKSTKQMSHTQKVNEWIDKIGSDSDAERPPTKIRNTAKETLVQNSDSRLGETNRRADDDAHPRLEDNRRPPSRKRSASEAGQDLRQPRTPSKAEEGAQMGSPKQMLPDAGATTENGSIYISAKSVNSDMPASRRPGSVSSQGHSYSTGHIIFASQNMQSRPPSADRAKSFPTIASLQPNEYPRQAVKKRKKRYEPTFLSPSDPIGDHDTNLVHDVLSSTEASESFAALKHNIAWKKMYHRTGEVPRLVAVQGTVNGDGSIPIYRHPADESPPLTQFDELVDRLRLVCEEKVGHELNHVLIQYYRNGEDNISEHSDKSLDILRGSSIVNLSLGAMRTMTLRLKRASTVSADHTTKLPATINATPARATQRIKLPHNSLFVLGEQTNANWLHSIRADKRPMAEKSEEELAYDGERISLTFRHIGTFVDLKNELIWGQGATGKTREDAKQILQGDEATKAGEAMIIGFGQENHAPASEWDWEETYGGGYDVVDFKIRAIDGP